MDEQGPRNYYVSKKDRLMKDFDKNIEYFRRALHSELDEGIAEDILKETRLEYEELIPRIPYIGGDSNRLTKDVTDSTVGLAFSKVLRRRGYSREEIVEHLIETMRAHFDSYSLAKMFLVRSVARLLFTFPLNRVYRRFIRGMAERSQRGDYSDNLVLHYVEGDGEEFDFGIDYTACPINKLWREQGMSDVLPYICLWDYYSSELTGSGLVRTMTLSEGFDRCDFRFKKGRKPENRQRTQLFTKETGDSED